MSTAGNTNHQLLLRTIALGGTIAPVLFILGTFVGALFYDDYSILLNKISELGGDEATTPAIQNLNFMILGLLILGFTGALHYDLSRLGVRTKGTFVLAIFGFSSALLNSVLPCDASCDGTTTEAFLHNLTGVGGFVAGMIAIVVLARVFKRLPEWANHYRFSQFCVGWWVLGFIGMAAAPDSLGGLAQRFFILSLLVWIEFTAIKLYRRLSAE